MSLSVRRIKIASQRKPAAAKSHVSRLLYSAHVHDNEDNQKHLRQRDGHRGARNLFSFGGSACEVWHGSMPFLILDGEAE